jgi:hypothetical protein
VPAVVGNWLHLQCKLVGDLLGSIELHGCNERDGDPDLDCVSDCPAYGMLKVSKLLCTIMKLVYMSRNSGS